jgi:hypothetical protein
MSTADPEGGRDPVASSRGADYHERHEGARDGFAPRRSRFAPNLAYTSIIPVAVGVLIVALVVLLLRHLR